MSWSAFYHYNKISDLTNSQREKVYFASWLFLAFETRSHSVAQPGLHSYPPASASGMLGLQIGTITSNSGPWFQRFQPLGKEKGMVFHNPL